MSKEKEKKEEKKEVKEAKKSPPKKKEKPAPAPKPVVTLITFQRWFAAKGFKPHWKAGMEAYAPTNGRRSMEEWDKLFANY